jgi:hypothetical protein
LGLPPANRDWQATKKVPENLTHAFLSIGRAIFLPANTWDMWGKLGNAKKLKLLADGICQG